MEVFVPIPVAAIGALTGYALGLPLGELIGAIAAVTIASKLGVSMRMPYQFVVAVQLMLGIGVGATVTPKMLESLGSISTLSGIFICMCVQIVIGYNWLRRVEQWGHVESLLGSVPGAMAAVMTVTGHSGNASGRIAFVHIVRLVSILIIVTIIAGGAHHGAELTVGVLNNYLYLLFPALVALGAGYLLERIDVPAPYMLTGLLSAAVSNVAFFNSGLHVPDPIAIIALILFGGLVGIKLKDITLGEVVTYIRAGLVVTTLTFSATSIVALIYSYFTAKSFLVLFMSWVPGGVEVMTAAALLLKLDPAFVMLNHVARMSIIHISPAILPKRIFSDQQA